MKVKIFLKKFLSIKVYRFFSSIYSFLQVRLNYEYFLILTVPLRHKRALKKIRGKNLIKVVFLVIHDSIWKYDLIYKLMAKDKRFVPLIVICPNVTTSERDMLHEMEKTYNTFKSKNYSVVKSLNEATCEWLDIRKQVEPDIVFFTNPYKLTKDQYFITNFLDKLTCYSPYGVTHTYLNHMQYNQLFHNVLWKYFVETELHQNFARSFARNKGRNVKVTGYPGIDYFFDRSYIPKDEWKISDRRLKRIIWAPHHTLDDDKRFLLNYSNFLKFHDYFLKIAEVLKSQIQICFKPHPLLKQKLYSHKNWGREKTDEYYNKWANLLNGQLNESNYIDLFLTSDALIFDSGSFINEYLCVNKPSLFILRDKDIINRFNEFGRMAFECHYKGINENDIIKFIENLLFGDDPLKEKRQIFVSKYLRPPNSNLASENIYKLIKNEIN